MSRSDQGRGGFPFDANGFFQKRDALVGLKHRGAHPEYAIAVPDIPGNIADLKTIGLALKKRAAETLECRGKE